MTELTLSVQHRNTINAATAEKDEAATAVARAHKAAKHDGLDLDALKAAIKLYNKHTKHPEKAAGFYKAFNEYCRDFGIAAQGDLLDGQEPKPAARKPVPVRGRRKGTELGSSALM
jgi:hypothetical protein